MTVYVVIGENWKHERRYRLIDVCATYEKAAALAAELENRWDSVSVIEKDMI